MTIGKSFLLPLMGMLGILLAATQIFLRRFMSQIYQVEGGVIEKVSQGIQIIELWYALALFFCAGLLWLWILPRVSLSDVYPMISLSYVAMLFMAYFWEGEAIYWTNIVGVLLIIGGVTLLAVGR